MDKQDWEPVIFNKTNKNSRKDKPKNTSTSYNKNDTDDIPEAAPKISLSNTQAQVAKLLNIDVNLYKKYENGSINPMHNILVKIEKALNIKLNKKKIQ